MWRQTTAWWGRGGRWGAAKPLLFGLCFPRGVEARSAIYREWIEVGIRRGPEL